MRTVSSASVAAKSRSREGLPPAVAEALGELAGAAKEGLPALSVGVDSGCCTSCWRLLVVRHRDSLRGDQISTRGTTRRPLSGVPSGGSRIRTCEG